MSTPSSTPDPSPSEAPASPRLVVDRIEGDRAILEGCGETFEIPAALLPAGAGEGSLLSLGLAPAPQQADAQAEAEARLARLQARSPKKPIIDL